VSARVVRCTAGRTGLDTCGSKELAGPRILRRCRRRSTGICGWGRLPSAPIPRRRVHSAGGAGGVFVTGAIGDMGCHIIDHPVWALKLGAPTAVEARTTLDGTLLAENKLNF